LGKDLFPDLLKRGGFATTIEGDVRQRFEENFEKGMEMFIKTRNVEISTLLREMSEYFVQFTPGFNNLYRRLATCLAQRQKDLGEHVKQRIVFATLNYDLLLELAILNAGCAVVYPSYIPGNHYTYVSEALRLRRDILNSYWWANYSATIPTIKTSAFEVLKVHGSCNFLLDIPPENFRGNTYENVGVAVEAPTIPVLPANKVLDWLRRSDSSLAPSISMYAEGKQVMFSRNYVQEHQSSFQTAVKEADRIFLIGVRIWRPDTHIWDHIAASKAWLGYAGGEPEEFRAWCRERRHSNHHVLGTYFDDSLPAIEQEIMNITR